MDKIKSFISKIKNTIEKVKKFYKKHEYLRVFTIIWGITFLLFAFQSIPNGLTLPVSGDYCLQQLHFYVEGHNALMDFFQTGEFRMWSYEGFLGYNYFAGNTFYYLTSPFSLPIFFLPASLIPQGIFIMMTVKIAVGGLLVYILLKKFFNASYHSSLIAGVAYGLCGWGFYYIWFNHFHDVLAVLPLTLIGVEYCIQKHKGWLLGVALFICGLVNYYFLFTFVFTTLFYGLFRFFQCHKQNKGHNFSIFIQALVFAMAGVGMCSFVIMPALKIVASMSRVSGSQLILEALQLFFENPTHGDGGYVLGSLKSFSEFFSKENMTNFFKYFFVYDYEGTQKLIYILVETVFPATSSWENALFSNSGYDNYVSNMYISTPLLMLLWPAIIHHFKTKKFWNIFGAVFMIAMPFIPFWYYLFSGFSTVIYGRWLIFMVLIMVVVAAPMVDKLKELKKWEIIASLIITYAFMGISIFYANKVDRLSDDVFHKIGIPVLFIYQLVVFALMWFNHKKDIVIVWKEKVPTTKALLGLIVLDLIVCGNIGMVGQGILNYWGLYGGQDRLKEQHLLVNYAKDKDDSFYRIFSSLADRDRNNLSMTLGYKGMGTFHSAYNTELDIFINDISRASYSNGNWSMGIDEKRYNLDTFLNVKYYILENDDTNIPLGFKAIKSTEHYTLYENQHFVELGYAMDSATTFTHEYSLSVPSMSFSDHYMYEAAMNEVVLLQKQDEEEIRSIFGNDLTFINSYATSFKRHDIYNGNLYFIPRETSVKYSVPTSSITSITENYLKNIMQQVGEQQFNFRNDYGFKFYGPWKENGMDYGDRIIIEFDSHNILCEDAEEIGGYHLITELAYGPNVNISFYSGNELVASDTHGINYYDHSGDHKYARGFYINKRVDKVEIELLNDTPINELTKYGLTFMTESFEEYKERLNCLAENPLKNIKHTNNTIDFTTDYSDKKMLVLSVPYDEGWSLTVNNEPAKIYKVDGGFIGIVANEGEQNYHLQYTTPNMKIGLVMTGASIFVFAVSFAVVEIIARKKKKEEIETKE